MEDLNLLAGASALVVGYVLKNLVFKGKDQKLRDAIPVFNFAIQFLSRLVLEAGPASAGVFGSVGKFLSGPVSDIALQSLVYTVLSSGAQSTTKNVAKSWGINTLAGLKALLISKLGGTPPAPPAVPIS